MSLSTLILCAILIKSALIHAEDGSQGPDLSRLNRVEDINLRYYNGWTFNQHVDFKLLEAEKMAGMLSFKKSGSTVFYIHGFIETALQESVNTVITAYLQTHPTTNIVLVDWSNMAFGGYYTNAAPNTKKVAVVLAQQIKKLVDIGLNLPGIHLVGHSLGGQVAGFTGKNLQQTHNIKLKRITGLDPAFPGFYPSLFSGHLSASDAEFVDVIHTDAGQYGALVNTGTLDFWPNGGNAIQPGCPLLSVPVTPDSFCSHWRSWRYWAESLKTPSSFQAVAANSYLQFKLQKNIVKPIIYMGIDADVTATGKYYLETNSASPFGKGPQGIK